MKVLLTRFGGIGDCFPVAACAKVLASRGDEVTLALRDDDEKTKQSLLFKHENDFKVIDYKQVGPWQDRCVPCQDGFLQIQSVYKDYDRVIDFMNIVENNSTSPCNNTKEPWEFWQRSRSSNWVNWYDLSLAWCNIDPTSVDTSHKRPKLVLSDEETKRAFEFKSKYKKLFVIHPFASSLARSWYQGKGLVERLVKDYPGCAVAFWNPEANSWDLITQRSVTKLEKLGETPLRETMVLISAADLVVTVDTGCSHIAEGLNTKAIVIYSTVPAWTRSKYYKYQTAIDLGEKNPEYYTFSLGLGDPLRVKEGKEALTEREKQTLQLYEKRAGLEEATTLLNTDARGAEIELRLIMGKHEAWERQQSKALSAVTIDMVYSRIKEII